MSQEKSLSSCILNSVHVRYTIIPSVFLSFIAFLSINSNSWIISDVHHFYFEMFAVILSTIVAFYCIARAYSLNEKFSLFIGIGFLTIAVIDLLHAILSYNAAGNNAFLDYFIPQTWFAGRTFLGAMLVVAVVKYTKTEARSISSYSLSSSSIRTTIGSTTHITENSTDKRNKELAATPVTTRPSPSISHQEQQPTTTDHKNDSNNNNGLHRSLLFSLIMLALLAIGVVDISLFAHFPGIVTQYPISRPYELAAFVLFSVALFYFYKRKLYKSEDVFYRGILGALIIDIFAQIIMSYSSVNFHTAHNVAHILKDSGYFVIVISLALSSIQHNKIARERAEIIRQQYLKLKETDKMKDEFINVAAHELRTPIQPILGISQILRSRLGNNNDNDNDNNYNAVQQREMLDIINRNAKRLQKLTENILDVTKIESRSLLIKTERFDLYQVIMNAIEDTTASSEYLKKQKSIRILYHPNHIFVSGDKTRIMQVISNLLNNSIKFTSEGSISITVEERKATTDNDDSSNNNVNATTITSTSEASQDHEIVVSIEDTGQGIDPEILPNLFSKFASNYSSGGTGLGLFISKSIIEAHGGKIWASNNKDEKGRKKKGAIFTFSLPLTSKRQQIQHQLPLLPSLYTSSTTTTITAATTLISSGGDNENKSDDERNQ